MTTVSRIKRLTEKECNQLYNSRYVKEGETYYTNPLTKKPIKENADTFKKIKSKCDSLNVDTQTYKKEIHNDLSDLGEDFYKWIADPKVDPFTKNTISFSFGEDNEYVDLYKRTAAFLLSQNRTKKEIKNILPNEHLIFGTRIDMLYNIFINENENDIRTLFGPLFNRENDKQVYKLHFGYKRFENIMYELYDSKYTILDQKILLYLTILFIDQLLIVDTCINHTLSQVDILNDNPKEQIQKLTGVMQITKTIQKFIESLDLYDDIENILIDCNTRLIKFVFNSATENRTILYPDTYYNEIFNKKHGNVFENLIYYTKELYDMYNFRNAPKKSPFENIENKTFEEIEDPLIVILRSIGFDNIDMSKLELKERTFKNDKEFTTYQKEYSYLKSKYEGEIKTWKDNGSPKGTPPMRPTMKLPNGNVINVTIHKLPEHIPDEDYKDIYETYNKNKKTIDIYKNMLNTGIYDILKMFLNNNMTPSNNTSKLLNQNRDFFENNVFDIGDDDRTKCNSNTDAISQEQFDDKNYLLAKLQLMFQLKTKDTDGNVIRTDCFYAPHFYNYIVSKINNKQPLVNPLTKQKITDEDIDELISIMKVVVPKIQKPIYTKPIYDTKLIIQHKTKVKNGMLFHTIHICRTFFNTEIIIFKLCSIPADIDVRDTNSADTTSDVFLYSIYKLFNSGKLLHTYVPKYWIGSRSNFIKPAIHFNRYRSKKNWPSDRQEVVRLFIHYFEELKEYL